MQFKIGAVIPVTTQPNSPVRISGSLLNDDGVVGDMTFTIPKDEADLKGYTASSVHTLTLAPVVALPVL